MEAWNFLSARDLGLSLGERLRSPQREAGAVEYFLHLLWSWFVRAYLRICHRLCVRGREHLPLRPPFVLVSNHGSHLDALAIASALPTGLQEHLYPLAARDWFFEKGLLAAFAALALNALPLRRRPSAGHEMSELRRRLRDEPCAFILFPEGTRTRTGEMGEFRLGIGRMVAGTSVPVVPCFLSGPFEAAPPNCLFPQPRKITLTIGAPLSFESEEDSREGWRRVALRVQGAVRALGGEIFV